LVAADLVDEAALLRGEKTIGAAGIDPLEGRALSALTETMQVRASEQVGLDTLEIFERT